MLLIKVSGHIREEGPVVPPCIVIWLIFDMHESFNKSKVVKYAGM